MRRSVSGLLVLLLLLGLCACGKKSWDTGEAQNLRLFCEEFSRYAAQEEGLARITPSQFFFESKRASYGAYLSEGLYLTCTALPNGRLHTISLTGLPGDARRTFLAAVRCLVQACTGAEASQTERWLGELQVGDDEIPGLRSLEAEGFRFSSGANTAGRYFRLSFLRFLPPEPELPTLRETLPN